MSRKITDHCVGGLNELLNVTAEYEPGSGGANHQYKMSLPLVSGSVPYSQCISFQNGPLGEAKANGTSNEAVLAVLIDRMRGFQSGKFACQDNEYALQHLNEALFWLQNRTRQRLARGVEGTLNK